MKRKIALFLSLAMMLAIILPVATAEGFNPKEEITLNFPTIWVGTDSKAKVFGEMVDEFNKEYAGKVKIVIEEQTDYQAYRDKIRTMIGAATHRIYSLKTHNEALAASGKLMDFSPYFEGQLG